MPPSDNDKGKGKKPTQPEPSYYCTGNNPKSHNPNVGWVKECGWVQDSKGNWHQYAHPSNNLTREQFPHVTTAWLASKEPETFWHHIWRRFIRGQEWGTLMENEQYAAKTALYKRHKALMKAEREFQKFEKKMLKNRHVDYTPVHHRHDHHASDDGDDGYRAPQQAPSSSSSSSSAEHHDAGAPPAAYAPYPLDTAGLTGAKEFQEETNNIHRNASLHNLSAAARGPDTEGDRTDPGNGFDGNETTPGSGAASRGPEAHGRREKESEKRDGALAIPPGW